MTNTQRQFENAFEEIKSSPSFKKILGFILGLGNILNGGTQKGQADGFYLDALSKATSMKDINGRTIMQIICERFKKEDEEFVNIKNEFKAVTFVTQYSLKEEDTKLKELKGNYEKAKGNLEIVLRLNGEQPEDPYIEKMKVFMAQTGKQIEEMEAKLADLMKTYAEACDYYLIEKSDEKATNSQEFFKFFNGFIDQVVKSMPKEEKKRAAAPKGAPAAGAAGAKVGAANMMAELKLKQGMK